MDELTFDNKTYVSSKRAAQITGYAKDYIGQLCREGRVEARLVGRNWYVLESSIREHRFGPESKKNDSSDGNSPKEASESSWESPKYISEQPESLSDFLNEKPVNDVNPAPVATFADSTVVKEMHDAWQDWFTQKSIQNPPEVTEEAQEESEVVEVQLHREPEPVEIPQEEPEIVPITRVEAPVEEKWEPEPAEEEVVPIHRTYMPPVAVVPPSQRAPSFQTPTNYAPEGRVIRERRVQPKKKPSLVLSAIFLALAVIAAAIGIIGSGKFSQFSTLSQVHYLPIQFLEGESVVSK